MKRMKRCCLQYHFLLFRYRLNHIQQGNNPLNNRHYQPLYKNCIIQQMNYLLLQFCMHFHLLCLQGQ